MELPEYITDYDGFFEDLGFPKEAVRNGDVRIIKTNSRCRPCLVWFCGDERIWTDFQKEIGNYFAVR